MVLTFNLIITEACRCLRQRLFQLFMRVFYKCKSDLQSQQHRSSFSRWRYAEEEESRLKLKLDASLAPSAVHPKNPQYPNYGAGGGGGSLAHPSRLSHSPSTWDAIIGDDVTQLFSR